MQTQVVKNIARRIEQSVNAKAPGTLKHSEALEIIAKALGYRSYQGCKASLDIPAGKKEFTEVSFTFHLSRAAFDELFEERNKDAFETLNLTYEIHYHDRVQVIIFSGHDIHGCDPMFLRNECIGRMLKLCAEKKTAVTMTVSRCAHEDCAYQDWVADAVGKAMNSPSIPMAEAQRQLEEQFPGWLKSFE